MTKKFYHVLAVMALCLTTFVLTASQVQAAVGDSFTVGDLTYKVLTEADSTGTVEVNGNSVWDSVTIPASVKNNDIKYSVTSIADKAFYHSYSLTSIMIPDSVTSIGKEAFYNCPKLTSVIIGNGVTSIGRTAFWNCTSLTSITMGNSVTSIGDSAFQDCSGLTNVKIPSRVTSIGGAAFSGCSLTSITIPDSVTSIGDWAFACRSLTSITVNLNNKNYSSKDGVLFDKDQTVLIDYPIGKKETNYTIPSSVTSIHINGFGDVGSAFSGCANLKSITISSSMTSIGSYVFSSCTSLMNVIIPDSITSIVSGAFSGCSLTNITVSADNPNYSSREGVLFNKKQTVLIDYPKGKKGSNYTIPSSVTSIENNAFSGSSSLTSITIPDSVVSIGDSAFSGCGLTSITIPNSVNNIGDQAFIGCRSLTSAMISDSVASIGSSTFYNCPNLTSVYYQGNPPSGGEGMYYLTPSTLISYYPAGNRLWQAVIKNGKWQDRKTATWNPPTLSSISINGSNSVQVGGTATYTCTANYSDGSTITVTPIWSISSGTSYASITSGGVLTGKAAGTATVKAAYEGMTATKNVTVNAAAVKPSITTQPKSQTVNEGSSVIFSVVATGTAPLTYQWKKNGSNISGATSDSYAISSAKASDDGSYTVTVSNSAGSVTSSAATLTVNVPVTLSSISISGNNSVNVGSTATYTCTATYSNGTSKTVTPTWSISAGISYASITSSGVLTGKEAGTATIQAKYTEGGVTKTVTMNVTVNAVVVKPSITTQPKSQTVNEGSSVTFDVTATGTDPLSYQWKKDGSNISGATSASYTISSAKTSDAGSYTVTVSNSAGSVTSSTATLTVTAKPTITVQPQNQTIKEGNAVTFSVTVTGAEPLSYQWYKNGFVLSGATENQYTIASVAESDAGQYFVIVSNSAGSVVSETASLVVTVPPVIVKQPESLSVLDGEEALFSVEAERATKYQWFKDSEPINGATNAVYRIANTVMDDMGEYYVLVENEYHSVQSDTVILEVYRLPVITKQPAGVSVSGGESATFSVEAENVTVYQWYKNGLAITGANESSYTIEAVNGYDVGEYSVVVSNEKASIVSDVVTLGISEAYRATAEPQVANGFVIGFVVTDPGWGYDFVPKVRVKDEFGEGAEAHCIVENGMIVGIVVDNPGSGYSEETYVKVGSPYKFNSLSIKVTEVEITMLLNLGELYQLESTVDHITWEKVGEPFIAEDEEVKLRLEVVDRIRYFRVHEVK